MKRQQHALSRASLLRIILWIATLVLCFYKFPVHARRSKIVFAPRTRLTWVNGIGYNSSHMELEAPVIADCFGGKPVEFYHNPTRMVDETDTRGYVSDLTQAGQQKYLGKITNEVNGLVQHLKQAVASVGHKGTVVHLCHSQGALVTCLAAKQLSLEEMERIEVIAFGGATPVRASPSTPFKRCVNYYSVNDPLLFINPSAETALRSGFHHHRHHHQQQHQEEFCFLAPRIGDPIADHMLLGPTYASALQWEGRRFQKKYQSLLYRSVRSTLLLVKEILVALLRLFVLVWERYHALFRATVQSATRSWMVLRTKILADPTSTTTPSDIPEDGHAAVVDDSKNLDETPSIWSLRRFVQKRTNTTSRTTTIAEPALLPVTTTNTTSIAGSKKGVIAEKTSKWKIPRTKP